MTIYRIVSYDYQGTRVETSWHTSRKWCEEWLEKCYFKNLCHIETDFLEMDEE